MFKHILIPTDGSELAEVAVKAGVDFARSTGAKVTGFSAIQHYPWLYHKYVVSSHLVTPQQWDEEGTKWAAANLEKIQGYAHDANVRYEGVYASTRVPYEAIIKTAEERGCDLIFMASHGRRGMAGLLLGSQAAAVLTHTKIPVIVYR